MVADTNHRTSASIYVRDTRRPTFHWEGDDLILDRKAVATARRITIKIQTHFTQKMGWMIKKKDGSWTLGPNLNYLLHIECTQSKSDGTLEKIKEIHQTMTSLSKTIGMSPMFLATDEWTVIGNSRIYVKRLRMR